MLQRDLSYLTDILEAARLIRSFIHDIDKERFECSPLIQSAVMRQIEIAGEGRNVCPKNSGQGILKYRGEI